MSKKKHTPKWQFHANSTTSTRSCLPEKDTPTPRVLYTPEVWSIIQLAIAHCEVEIGWLGLVRKHNETDYLVYDVFIPKQTVSHTETDIDESAMSALANEIFAAGEDPGNLYYWGHSHVDMGVQPSGQDEAQVAIYLDSLPVLIRGIYNKRGESNVCVFDTEQHVVFERVENGIYALSDEGASAWIEHIDKNVKQRKVVLPPTTRFTPAPASPVSPLDPNGDYEYDVEDVLFYDPIFSEFHFRSRPPLSTAALSPEEEDELHEQLMGAFR
jgi:hypothetical protein